MANNESFVAPNRGGGTGAAAILTPSNETDKFLATYDAMKKQKPDAYYDSLGNDIRQGLEGSKGVENVNDRLFIDTKKNDVIKMQSELYYTKKPFSQNPEGYKKYYSSKKDLVDWTSKALMDQKTYTDVNKEILAKEYKYDVDKSKEAIKAWYETPLDQRAPRPELIPIDQSNYNKIYKSFGGKSHIKNDSNGNYIDGTGSQIRTVSFNPEGAAADFDTIVRLNPNTADIRRVFKIAADQAQEAALANNEDWSQLPQNVRDAAIFEQAKDNYVSAMEAGLEKKTARSSAFKTPTNSKKTPTEMASAFDIDAIVTPKGVKRVVVLDLLGLENKDKDNSVQTWITGETGEKSIVGRAQRVTQEEGNQPYVEVNVVSKEGNSSLKKVPYSFNKEKVKTDYQVDFDKDRPTDFANRYYNFTAKEDVVRLPFETEEDYIVRKNKLIPVIQNYNKRERKGSTPKSTPAKASTTKTKIDPVDEEFFRK
jgi:hypothetical protein